MRDFSGAGTHIGQSNRHAFIQNFHELIEPTRQVNVTFPRLREEVCQRSLPLFSVSISISTTGVLCAAYHSTSIVAKAVLPVPPLPPWVNTTRLIGSVF